MEAEILSQSLDKSQIPPLHQKRILAFINHFLINSCSFLNEFTLQCETKFIELERKIQKVEAALTIIEAKLASIPDSDSNTIVVVSSEGSEKTITITAENAQTEADKSNSNATVESTEPVHEPEPVGVRVCDDVRYKKFFKMVQFGVPAEAVKLKMHTEGVEPSLLDTPNRLLPDGIAA